MADGLSLQGGYLQRISAGATLEQTQNALNDVINRLNNQLQTQVYSDGVTKRMLIGYQLNGWGTGQNFGIKVSLEGVDVNLATDGQLLFKMALDKWTWRNSDGQLTKIFDIAAGHDVHYDVATGDSTVLLGSAPDDKRAGAWVAKPGEDVITNLGG